MGVQLQIHNLSFIGCFLALSIIPAHIAHLAIQTINSIYDRFGTDLDSTKTSFEEETTWTRSKEKRGTIAEIVRHPSSCIQMFPNVIKVLQLFYCD